MESPTKKEVYWYTKKKPEIKKLESNAIADVAIIGGGMAGLSAAHKLAEAGQNVIILEKDFCGGGASGKSSGFITPDSELEFVDLVSAYGSDGGVKMYDFATSGVDLIRQNIKNFNFDCDYQTQDALFVANSKKSRKILEKDQEARRKFNYQSRLYSKEEVSEILDSRKYYGALRYPESFGINSYLYCQSMKENLLKRGVRIYEGISVSEIMPAKLQVGNFNVLAKNIIVAADYFLADLNIRKKDIYHVQTFLTVSKPITPDQIKKIFPNEQFMVWDTDLIYQYFRLIEGNRLLFGATNILYAYKRHEQQNYSDVIRKIQDYIKEKFGVSNLIIEYSWPGMLGITKDFVPIAGEDSKMKNVYYIGGASGLPWAAALGNYIAEKIINGRKDYDSYFRADRHYPVNNKIQTVISKPLAFAISHGIVEYFK